MDETQTHPELSQAEQVPASPPPRKRRLDSDDDAEPQTKRARTTRPTSEPARLTRKNLALFNKIGHSKKTSTHRDSDDSTTTKSLSTTASGFDVRAKENGILDPIDSRPPKNLEEIRKRLAKSRETASPPESVYEDYVYKVGTAHNEATVVYEVGGKLLKEYPGRGYKREFNQPFTGYPKDVGFNNGLSAPQPDFVEGLDKGEYDPLPIDKHVSGAVLYKDDRHSVTLPHIAGEWKGPGGSMQEATLQSAYNGAALVHARNQARQYSGTSDPAGHAHVTTFTTNGAQLNFYAHYAAPSEDGTLEYYQYPVKTTNLTGSHQEYKEGRRYLRNEQDHAKKQSYKLRDELKDYYRKQRGSGLILSLKECRLCPYRVPNHGTHIRTKTATKSSNTSRRRLRHPRTTRTRRRIRRGLPPRHTTMPPAAAKNERLHVTDMAPTGLNNRPGQRSRPLNGYGGSIMRPTLGDGAGVAEGQASSKQRTNQGTRTKIIRRMIQRNDLGMN